MIVDINLGWFIVYDLVFYTMNAFIHLKFIASQSFLNSFQVSSFYI